MSRPVLYIAITNHGFGHAVRAASVAAAIQQMNPEILLVLVTTAPHWLLESYISGDFIVRPRAFDVGVVQSDSLTMDKNTTLKELKQIRERQRSIIATEVSFIHLNKVKLILADIPPLAAPIAKAAGIPCWMMSNFGWDFIYRPWGGDFIEMADWIGECFSQCDRLFRLPFHETMSAFPNITDVGLTGGSPRYSEDEIRGIWGLTAPQEKIVLLTFGGLGLAQIPYSNLQKFSDWQFLTFDQQAPDFPNLIKVSGQPSKTPPFSQLPLSASQSLSIRPVDFMPLCGRVISKPGYSTFAEALRVGVPIVSVTREEFAESPLLLEGIADRAYHQIISPADFFEGSWEFLRQPLQPPRLNTSIPKDGTEAIASAVVDYLQNC
ncbi:glycosyl transferase [Microcoleus sp. FACHB-672]|uniref:glycosyl transferase n=1 Tax=Microcoleus sp. FACHB-672 TaxID=2692825 RepID=UPI0016831B11|nr:glycosyl transferase [Microcoleus sp. FACHB-672]MBD2040716.1 glycosyl transferase [Microcoleus sp. FACHB-672]